MTDDSQKPYDPSHPYQRQALDVLECHVSMSLRDIAEAIAVEEYGSVTSVPSEEFERIERELERVHVPELEERSHVRYDDDRGVVSLLGHGADACVELSNQPDCGVALETADSETVEVELSEATLERIHEAMIEDDRLDPQMSYDEVVQRLAADD